MVSQLIIEQPENKKKIPYCNYFNGILSAENSLKKETHFQILEPIHKLLKKLYSGL